MNRYYYFDKISDFLLKSEDTIFASLAKENEFSLEGTQRHAWLKQIEILKKSLNSFSGDIFFEFSIPRMGQRIDVVLVIKNVIFVLEFKIGESEFLASGIDQVWDYALDLKNFHEKSHENYVAPILIATEANSQFSEIFTTIHNDKLLFPVRTDASSLRIVIDQVLSFADRGPDIIDWHLGRYAPTPSIVEAAIALYKGHSVSEISKSDASATNLSITSKTLSDIINTAKKNNEKAICFVTGVPGAGKTLVGLDIAAKHLNKKEKSSTVFLSGNGPLVAILREALTRDRLKREKERGKRVKKGEIFSQVKLMVQNVHHFRDDCLKDISPPFEHVAIFDEAQRAWNKNQTVDFMKRKKGVVDFSFSEPEFLISCLDRHTDWAVIICLVGGGQEINTGEAGISEWLLSLNRSFPKWHVYISDNLTDSEYAAGQPLDLLENHRAVFRKKELHLSVSRRSYRAEHLSLFVKNLLDLKTEEAKKNYNLISKKYPLVLSRDLNKAKAWLKQKARGTERYGMIVSSQAQRLKPFAMDVKSPMDPVHWFLDGKEDVRSSYYLEDVATEFSIQGLELDWVCVTWDADFRYSNDNWNHFSFVGSKWNKINKEDRKTYLKNAYRVILTRARQGMVIVIPLGDPTDPTRASEYYDPTYSYLRSLGIQEI